MALNFEFEIDADKFIHALNEYPDHLRKTARVAVKERLVQIQTRAAIIHRYTTRSGALSKAFEIFLESDFAGELHLSKTISNAPYAFAIHEGRPDWKNYIPDRFLFNSFDYHEEKEPFKNVCIGIVDETLRKARLI